MGYAGPERRDPVIGVRSGGEYPGPVLYGIAAALPVMQKQKSGEIVNVSPTAGHDVEPAVYSWTKYAVRAISDGPYPSLRSSAAAQRER